MRSRGGALTRERGKLSWEWIEQDTGYRFTICRRMIENKK